MFDAYLERITNEAYYNNMPDQRVLEEIEEVKEKLEELQDKISETDLESEKAEDLIAEVDELNERLEELEELAYGSN